MRLFLAAAVLSTACAGDPAIIARHQPMHPGNGQAVTFTANAENADVVELSYRRYALRTGAAGSHIYESTGDRVVVKVCDPPGDVESLTCEHTMAAPFPPASLIAFSAWVRGRNGQTQTESYAFAAGDYPWPDDPIPIRIKDQPDRMLDVVFVPDTDLTMEQFRDKLDELVEFYFNYGELRLWRGLNNFFYSARFGDYERPDPNQPGTLTNPTNMANVSALADAIAFVHATELRDITRAGFLFTTEIYGEKSLIHESGHALFGLTDEYCCSNAYRLPGCLRNVYASLAECQGEAAKLRYPLSHCRQLADEIDGSKTKNLWRVDPGTESEPGCIMGFSQNNSSSSFRLACARRIRARYGNCATGDCSRIECDAPEVMASELSGIASRLRIGDFAAAMQVPQLALEIELTAAGVAPVGAQVVRAPRRTSSAVADLQVSTIGAVRQVYAMPDPRFGKTHDPDERASFVLPSARSFVYVPLSAGVTGISIEPLRPEASRGGTFDIAPWARQACAEAQEDFAACRDILTKYR